MLDTEMLMDEFPHLFKQKDIPQSQVEAGKSTIKNMLTSIREQHNENLTRNEKQKIALFIKMIDNAVDSTEAETTAEKFGDFIATLEKSGKFDPEKEFVKIKNPQRDPGEILEEVSKSAGDRVRTFFEEKVAEGRNQQEEKESVKIKNPKEYPADRLNTTMEAAKGRVHAFFEGKVVEEMDLQEEILFKELLSWKLEDFAKFLGEYLFKFPIHTSENIDEMIR
jgi:hypothetical protein